MQTRSTHLIQSSRWAFTQSHAAPPKAADSDMFARKLVATTEVPGVWSSSSMIIRLSKLYALGCTVCNFGHVVLYKLLMKF